MKTSSRQAQSELEQLYRNHSSTESTLLSPLAFLDNRDFKHNIKFMGNNGRKKARFPKDAKIDPFTRASEIFSENVQFFQNACEIYKQVLDRILLYTFCRYGHCEMVYMIEMKFNGSRWGATPKILYSEEEARKEAEALKVKYPFISEFKIITREIGESLIRSAKNQLIPHTITT